MESKLSPSRWTSIRLGRYGHRHRRAAGGDDEKELRDRVSTALTNSGLKFPMGRSRINLAPADVRKEGPSFDLHIAIGMLAANDRLMADQLEDFVVAGGLALTGQVARAGFLPIGT
jgi:magnesium chelatase family protein